jgi:hypothetical protein
MHPNSTRGSKTSFKPERRVSLPLDGAHPNTAESMLQTQAPCHMRTAIANRTGDQCTFIHLQCCAGIRVRVWISAFPLSTFSVVPA